ncbi:MAG: AsmA family protein, partial [Pseudomonadota bacterium]|nr:AsmA family protein [Pseudomonadota bacterium]
MNIIRKIQAMKKRILIISVIVFAALVLLVAGGLAIFIATFDLADHRDRIEAEASRALGRNVELNGELSLEIGLHPEIVISDVRAPNADWAHDPLMLRLGRMEAR